MPHDAQWTLCKRSDALQTLCNNKTKALSDICVLPFDCFHICRVWEVVFVCVHLHVCTAPIKTALLANDREREIVCVRLRTCACTQAFEMVAVKGGLLGKR